VGDLSPEARVSTHSRAKAAALKTATISHKVVKVSTRSRLKAAEPLSKVLLHQVSQPRFR